MAKSREVFGCFYVCGCIMALGLLISTLVLVILARAEAATLKGNYIGLTANWYKDMIYDVTTDSKYTLPTTDYYLSELAYRWPGTVEGCYCTVSSRRYRVTVGLKDRPCNRNETRMSCAMIPSTAEQNLTTWINGQKLYAVRMMGTSFMETYKYTKADGSCEGYRRNCGNIESKSKGACIPLRYSTCPLTSIQASVTADFESRDYLGFSLQIARKNNSNPITDFSIEQNHLCFVRSNYPLTPDREKYKLLKGDFKSCHKDESAWQVGEMGEKTFLDLNNFDYRKFPEFGVSDSVKYRIMVASIFEWSPSCSDSIQTLIVKSDDIDSIEYQYFVLIIVFSISFGLNILCLICQCWCILGENKILYSVGIVVRIVCLALCFPSIVITYRKTVESHKFFTEIAAMNCSNDQTNASFKTLVDYHLGSLSGKSKAVIGLAISGFLIEMMLMVIVFACYETSGEFASKKKQDFSEAGYAESPEKNHRPGTVFPAGKNKEHEDDDKLADVDKMTNAGYPLPPGFDNSENKPLPPGFLESANNQLLPPGFIESTKGKPLPPGFASVQGRPGSAPLNQRDPRTLGELPPGFHESSALNSRQPNPNRLPPLPKGFLESVGRGLKPPK